MKILKGISMRKAFATYKAIPVQARASFWFLICSFLQKGISVLSTPIFARLLSTEEYGQFNVFNSWLGIVTVIVCLDLYAGVYIRGLVKHEEDRARFSSSLQGLTLVLISIWTVIYSLSRSFWNNLFDLTTIQMYAMFVMIWTSAAFRFWAAEKRVRFSYRSLVIVTLIVSLAKPGIGILFVIQAEDKVTARIIGLVLVELICYSWLFFVQMIRGKQFYNKRYWIYALSFNLPLIPHYLSQTVLNSSDRLMIKSMVGKSEAGIYSLAYSVSQIMLIFNQALLQTIEPWVYLKIKARKADEIKKVAYPAFGFIGIVNLFLIILAPEVIYVYAPPMYYDSIWVIPPVAMSVFFSFSYSFFASFEFYYEKTKFVMTASIVGAGLNILLNMVFIRIFGYYAAGYTTLFCYIVFSVGHFYFMTRICRKELNGIKVYNAKILLVMSGSVVLIGFGMMALYSYPYIRYGIVGCIFLISIIYRKQLMRIISSFVAIKKSRITNEKAK